MTSSAIPDPFRSQTPQSMNNNSSRETSPFQSVNSDMTMEDYYFESQQRSSPRNNPSSPLEYSDESDDFDSKRGSARRNAGMNGRQSSFQQSRSNTDSPLLNDPRSSSSSRGRSGKKLSLNDVESQQRRSVQRISSKSRSLHNVIQDDDEPNWMQRWAYSFRSPVIKPKQKVHHHSAAAAAATEQTSHRRHNSNAMEEYPHYSLRTEQTRQQPLSIAAQHGLSDESPHAAAAAAATGALVPPPPPPPPLLAWTQYSISSPTTKTYETNSTPSRVKSHHHSNHEESPLLGANFASQSKASLNDEVTPTSAMSSIGSFANFRIPSSSKKSSVQVAAAFLQDYEANRPPTLCAASSSSMTAITDYQIALYHIKYSLLAEMLRMVATIALCVSSFLERFPTKGEYSKIYPYHFALTGLNVFAVVVFMIDVWMHRELQNLPRKIERPLHMRSVSTANLLEKHTIRTRRSDQLIGPLILFCVALLAENATRLYFTPHTVILYTSIFKPLVLFYISAQARDAFVAFCSILRIVVRVLAMELFLILMFAAVACRLFPQYDNFEHLGVAWVSLFELATTVVNPSVWMPIYQDSPSAALFFIFFIITAGFYLHSLVLSVVFQTYIQAAAEIHERNASDREDAVQFAFLALVSENDALKFNDETSASRFVHIRSVRQALRVVRPHYSSLKINALVDIVDPSGQGQVDYATFRTKIRQALNSSIRTARSASNLAMSVELVAVAVAIVNFLYVILLSLAYQPTWFKAVEMEAGCLITLVASFELLIRLNPLRIPDFTPLTRLNAMFDGTAFVAASISCVGIVMYLAGYPLAMEYILIGRALDMVRSMRFFHVFRDIVRRTSEVFPAIRGPLILGGTTIHVFVYAGMALWGGAVEVGQHGGEIFPFYDLNNFNSYREGTVTVFQVVAVNDWYAIADVFLLATRNSNAYIVYGYFILGNLICVNIMLNVLTAFFVESFVTKLHDDKGAASENTSPRERERTVKRSEADLKSASANPQIEQTNIVDWSGGSDDSSESDRIAFDVFERQGFDKIMQTVAGSVYNGDCARDICSYLEIYESLAPGRETVGYLVCDHQTLERFGNRRFKTKAIGFLDENALHSVVSEMHSGLLSLAPQSSIQDRSLVQTFPHKREAGKSLEISAALLRRHPALSLFVSRTLASPAKTGTPPLSGNVRR